MSAENDGTRFYLKDKEFFIIIPLKEVAKQLPDNHFLRIFRSTIVNISYIQLVHSKHIVLENGKELVMSRTYKENVKSTVAAKDRSQ
jgi:DNA-binding LytR/AlgR family response regulator